MAIRTTRSTVTFAKSFTLGDLGEILPSGVYDVETDEELIEGLTFPVYRRLRTVLHLPVIGGSAGLERLLTLDPDILDEALARDNAPNTA